MIPKDFGKVFSPLFFQALVLRLLTDGPKHGYEIAERVSELAGIEVAKPLVYITLKKMELLGLIRSEWKIDEGRARKVYYITEAGENFLNANRALLSKLKELLDYILS